MRQKIIQMYIVQNRQFLVHKKGLNRFEIEKKDSLVTGDHDALTANEATVVIAMGNRSNGRR